MKSIAARLGKYGLQDVLLLHCGMSGVGKRRGVMSDQQPALFAEDKYVGGLDHGVIKTIGKRGGDVFGACYPTDIAFDSDPDGAKGDADAARVSEKASPAVMHFFPAKQKLPAWVDTLDFFVVRPYRFHLSEVERFEGGVKTRVCSLKSIFGSLFLRHGLRGHVKGWKLRANPARSLALGQGTTIPILGVRKFHAADCRQN